MSTLTTAADTAPPSREQRLINFAERVLEILEDDFEWSSDTTDEIAAEANGRGLSHNDSDGYFRRLP